MKDFEYTIEIKIPKILVSQTPGNKNINNLF